MMNKTQEIVIPIDDSNMIDVIRMAMNGAIPVSQLQRKLGRRRADKGISKCEELVLKLHFSLRGYIENFPRDDWEFFKKCMGLHNGYHKKMIKLSDTIEIREMPGNMMFLIIKGDKP